MARKKRQTRLTFEPVGASGSPSQSSPATAPYTGDVNAGSSPSGVFPSQDQTTRTLGHLKKMQSGSRGSTGPSENAISSTKASAVHFMPKLRDSKRIGAVDDSDSATEADDKALEREENNTALKSSQSVSTRLRHVVIEGDDNDDDEDDEEPIAPPSALKRRRPAVTVVDEDEDEDDKPIVMPSPSKRSRPLFIDLEGSSDEDASPVKKRKMRAATPGRLKRPASLASSSPTKRGAPKGRRSEKQKKMELLRRRRAGEKIDELTSSEEDSGDEKRGIYDTDSEDEFVVLKEFDDEEPAEENEGEGRPSRTLLEEGEVVANRSLGGSRHHGGGDENGDDDDLNDFIADDDDAPLGAPANLGIPLEFTSLAHRPLKYQFPYAIEWLVHNRINPAFERNDPLYTNAWRKLNDEIQGLASSKFASAAWKAEFYRTLKGRPKMEAYEIDGYDKSSGLYDTCDACGRGNHPASFRVVFQGHPYYKNTLAEVESDSDESEGDGDEASDRESVDTQGMTLPPVSKEWYVGTVCCSNAETAHSLIHWRHALKEWVEERLGDEGWMTARRLRERERMKAGKRRKLANHIADDWRKKGIVASLYREFKNTLEEARNKATTGRIRGGLH